MSDIPEMGAEMPQAGAEPRELPGEHLRALREAAGWTVVEVAQAIKFSPRQIDALERDDLAALPPGQTFVRGFIRSYAKLLRTDPEPILALLEQEEPAASPEIGDVEDLGARLPVPGDRNRWMPAVAVVVAAVAAMALGIHYFGRSIVGVSAPPPGADQMEPQSAALPVMPPALPMGASQPAISSAAGDMPAAAPLSATATALPPQPAAPAPASTQPPVAAANPQLFPAATAAAAPAAVAHQLAFTFEDKAWVEVKDASARVIFAQLNAPGSRQVVTGKPPFQVVVGNAAHVRLRYDERPVDLAPHIRAEVARLSLE